MKESQELIPYDKKPDFDNVAKMVADTMKEMGFYTDDAKVTSGHVDQWYAVSGADPGAEIKLLIWE
jgi:Holliday junction resolvase RusA-like endonuclease